MLHLSSTSGIPSRLRR